MRKWALIKNYVLPFLNQHMLLKRACSIAIQTASAIQRKLILASTDVLSKSLTIARASRIKPDTTISIVTACGNRLEHLKVSLPTFLNQTRNNYDVFLSIYADKEGSEQYVRANFSDQLESGRLKLVVTDAEVFNKAKAINSAAIHSESEYLFLIDIDTPFSTKRSLQASLISSTFVHVNWHRLLIRG